MYSSRRPHQSRFRRPSGGQRSPGRRIRTMDISLLTKKAGVEPQSEFVPTHTFAGLPLSPRVQQNITNQGFTTLTPIQDRVIPEICAGRDVVGIAQTGTGKTAAFLLPLITKADKDRTQKMLIIVPTRELAIQIEDEYWKFALGMRIGSVVCVGGMPINRQIYTLRRNPQFVIGTPGRLKDLELQGQIRFQDYQTIVLDEVDRMLDMGFIRDIEAIMHKTPHDRHTLFFSATVPEGVRGIMQRFLTNPVTVSIETRHAPGRVNQDVIRTNGRQKIELLHELLIQAEFSKVLLFGRTKHGIERLSKQLLERGFKVAAIHGNKRQSQRQRALDEFKLNRVQVLLATDVASRGIDVADITHVINYDLPESYEDYIHRIGRTGRANKGGTALTFVD